MNLRTPIVPMGAEGERTTTGDRNQIAVSPPTEIAEAAAREVGDVSSNVNLKIIETLTAMQERMAHLELSRPKRKED